MILKQILKCCIKHLNSLPFNASKNKLCTILYCYYHIINYFKTQHILLNLFQMV